MFGAFGPDDPALQGNSPPRHVYNIWRAFFRAAESPLQNASSTILADSQGVQCLMTPEIASSCRLNSSEGGSNNLETPTDVGYSREFQTDWVQSISSDHGSEFQGIVGEDRRKYDITTRHGLPLRSRTNATSERFYAQSSLLCRFWALALTLWAHTDPRAPCRDDKSPPHEILFGRPFDAARLQRFGKLCCILEERENRDKFEPTPEKAIIGGYGPPQPYFVLDLKQYLDTHYEVRIVLSWELGYPSRIYRISAGGPVGPQAGCVRLAPDLATMTIKPR